jgi:hypothetical protein
VYFPALLPYNSRITLFAPILLREVYPYLITKKKENFSKCLNNPYNFIDYKEYPKENPNLALVFLNHGVVMAKFSFEWLRRLAGEPSYSNASHKLPSKKNSPKFHTHSDFKITIIFYTCNLNPDASQIHVEHMANDNYGRSKRYNVFKCSPRCPRGLHGPRFTRCNDTPNSVSDYHQLFHTGLRDRNYQGVQKTSDWAEFMLVMQSFEVPILEQQDKTLRLL